MAANEAKVAASASIPAESPEQKFPNRIQVRSALASASPDTITKLLAKLQASQTAAALKDHHAARNAQSNQGYAHNVSIQQETRPNLHGTTFDGPHVASSYITPTKTKPSTDEADHHLPSPSYSQASVTSSRPNAEPMYVHASQAQSTGPSNNQPQLPQQATQQTVPTSALQALHGHWALISTGMKGRPLAI